MSSITTPSILSSVTISSSHYGVTLSSSPASGVRGSSSQVLGALTLSQNDSTVPPSFRSVTSSSHSLVTVPLSQYRLTVSSSQLPVTPSPSQLGLTLSLSKLRGTLFSTLTSLQETIRSSHGLVGTASNTVEAFEILNSSIPFDGTISRTYYANNATDSTLVETNMPPTLMGDQTLSLFLTQSKSPFHKSLSLNNQLMADTVGQASHNLASTSSLTSGNSTVVIFPTIFQLHQSAEISHVVPTMNGNNFQGTVGLSTKTSASLQSLLTGDKSILSNLSYEDFLVTDTLIGPSTINSLHQGNMQKTQYISLHSFANILRQTSLTGIASHVTDSTYSTSTASISSSHQSVSSSSDSRKYHLHSNSRSSSSKAYSSTSVDYRFTGALGSQSAPIWIRSAIAIVSFSGKTILISDKFSSLSRTSGNF